MKVSLNWMTYYTDLDLMPDGVDKLVEKIGAQLGAVEEVTNLGERYKGIIFAKVVSCEKHDNSDHLSICKIDDGGKNATVERDENGLVQVVCGAPNVAAGQTVVWLPPGVTVPSTFGNDPLVLEVRDIRGQKSNGMLASLKELAIGDDHRGIVVIDEDVKPGDDFAHNFQLDDYIIDIENKMFTHRPDCFGILGVARELAGIQALAFKSPDWYLQAPQPVENTGSHLPLKVFNDIPNLVPRMVAVVINDITIAPSPIWLQSYVNRVGIRAINNVVDLTNFYMQLTGQPMHAFDYDKIKQLSGETPTLGVRLAKDGETLTVLGGKKLTLTDKDMVLATDKEPADLAGIIGGGHTEVDENTKTIILTCTTFDMYAIRRSMMRHGVFTEAATRNTKGLSPWQNDRITAITVKDILKYAGGHLASETFDLKGDLKSNPTVQVTAQFINDRLGETLSADDMATLLKNVEFEIQVHGDELSVTAPFWRTDIEIPEDIVEEVGRLYGYDKLPLKLPRRDIAPAEKNPMLELKTKLRDQLSKAGANELLTYSFVHGNLLDKVGQNKDNAFQLSNALSPDLQYYRQSLIPSLLDKVHANIKVGYDEFALFEINQTHAKDLIKDDLPIEEYRLGLVFAADDKLAKEKYAGAAYYEAQHYLTNLLAGLGITDLTFESAANYEPKLEVSRAALAPFEKSRTSIVKTADGQFIGELGEFTASVRRNLKLPQFIAGFELDVKQLLKLQNSTTPYTALPRFPKVEQDISLKVAADLAYQELFSFVWQTVEDAMPGKTYVTLNPLDIYQRDDDTAHKQITLRLSIASYEKTMTDAEVNSLLDRVAASTKEKFAAERL